MAVPPVLPSGSDKGLPVWPVTAGALPDFMNRLDGPAASWVRNSGFRADSGKILLVPSADGGLAGVILGMGAAADAFAAGVLPEALPEGTYAFAHGAGYDPEREAAFFGRCALAWALGAYRFSRYRAAEKVWPALVLPEGCDHGALSRMAQAVYLVRDLVNTPASDLGPEELERAVREAGRDFGAEVNSITGEALLTRNYPMIHAVGQASGRAPRLVDLRWQARPAMADTPRITLVGKGVCFDTGGLNLKTGNAMALMKKDMGGAAHVLGLARLIMGAGLPVRLRVLIPAVDNSVAGNAYRPGDVLNSRKGLTVEIGNTDAEGRLILADALHEADGEAPDLLIGMATLTGAARVALGPEVVPFYTQDDALAQALARHAETEGDPMWRMPLWKPYDSWLKSDVADVSHISEGSFAGSITAALFLNRFVEKAKAYVHLDLYAWAPKAAPAVPKGAAVQGLRALYAYLQERYG